GPFARNVAGAHARERLFGGRGGDVDNHFLRAAHVGREVGGVPFALQVADGHAVDVDPLVREAAAVNRQELVLQVVDAADVGLDARADRRHARNETGDVG